MKKNKTMTNLKLDEKEAVIAEPTKEVEAPKFLGDTLDFKNLFRVKGKKGFFYPVSGVNKSGLIGVAEFLTNNSFTVKSEDLVCLDNLIFKTQTIVSGDPIKGNAIYSELTLKDVFNNLDEYYSKEDAPELSNREIMGVMVPNYDPNEFKDYHAEMVIDWFVEVNDKMKKLVEENT